MCVTPVTWYQSCRARYPDARVVYTAVNEQTTDAASVTFALHLIGTGPSTTSKCVSFINENNSTSRRPVPIYSSHIVNCSLIRSTCRWNAFQYPHLFLFDFLAMLPRALCQFRGQFLIKTRLVCTNVDIIASWMWALRSTYTSRGSTVFIRREMCRDLVTDRVTSRGAVIGDRIEFRLI